MKKITLLFSIIAILNAEPSAFEAGDLNSNNPYGLTKDEKYIWNNKQDIKKLQKIITSQTKEINDLKLKFLNYKMKVDTLSQQLDGIQTILPSLDNLTTNIATLKQDLNSTNMVLFNLKDEVAKLKQQVNQNKKLNEHNVDTIINLVEKLAKRIDKIQQNQVVLSQNSLDFKSLSNIKIFRQAIDLYHKSKYAKAQEMLNYLAKKNYNLGAVNFYLGEIEYKRGYYKNALGFYKKSIQNTKNTKTYYMDDLLYHTGYSLEKIGNKIAAKKSYLKLIQDFPKSVYVKYAQKRVQNLEKAK